MPSNIKLFPFVFFLFFFANVVNAFVVEFDDVFRHETNNIDYYSGIPLSHSGGNAYISDKAVGVKVSFSAPVNGDSFGVNFINPDGIIVSSDFLSYSSGCWRSGSTSWCYGGFAWKWHLWTYTTNYGKPGTWTFEIVTNDQVTYTGTFGLIPRTLNKAGGDGQTIVVAEDGSFDAIPLSVQLIDYDGSSPKGGEPVEFIIESAPKGNKNGSVTSSATTNSQGIASADFTPGTKTGAYSIIATTRSDPDNPQTFTINVEVPPSLHGKQEDPLGELNSSKNHGAGNNSICKGTPPPLEGNPINIGTGNKYQYEPDYASVDSFPLIFDRHYNSDSPSNSSLGRYWRGTYDRSISVYEVGKGRGKTQAADVYRHDGKVYTFTLSNGQWQGDPDVADRLIQTASGWRYIQLNNQYEDYDTNGRLIALSDRIGRTQQLSYNSANQLIQVSSDFGPSLTFNYNSAGLLASMTDPANNIYQYHYDTAGNLSRVDYPDGTNRQYPYENIDHPHALTGIINENGARFATWNYDSFGRAISSEHAGGAEKVQVLYNTDGSRTVTNNLGGTKTYFLKNAYGAVKVTGLDKQACSTCLIDSASFNYDSQGYPNKKVDPNGNISYSSFNARGLPIYQTLGVGTADEKTRTLVWHDTLNLPTAIHEPGKTTYLNYDSKGNVLEKREMDTATKATQSWNYSYTPGGLIESEDGPRVDINDVTHYQYYPNGRLWRMINPLGHVLEIMEYDAHGRVLKYKDQNALITTLSYNPRGQLTSKKTGNELTLNSYDSTGQLVQTTWPDQTVTNYEYDDAGRLVLMRDHWNNETRYQYDINSHLIQKSIHAQDGTLQQQQSWGYDATGRLISKTGAAGQVTQYSYDSNGNLITVTDAKSQAINNVFDAHNRPTTTSYPDTGIVNSVYDKQDNLISVTDAEGHTTHYTYNGLGQRIETDSPDTGITSYSYDIAGNLINETRANGKILNYHYDALNRLVKAIDNNGSPIDYQYDNCTNGIGRLCSITGSGFSSSWQYDLQGRVITRQETTQSVNSTVSYQYNALGQLSAITYPSGKTVSYQYIDGHLESVSIDGTTIIYQISYNAANQVTGWNWANGEVTLQSYDLDGQLIQQTLADTDRSLAYDLIGNILSIDDGFNFNSYEYDSMSRLIGATGNQYDLLYSYDKNGNRLTEDDGIDNYDYAYNTLNNQLTDKQGTIGKNYQYDLAGNMLSDGQHSYRYDGHNQLIEVLGIAGYFYNGLGQRVAKNSHGTQTLFVYDEDARLIGEYSATGQAITETVYLFGQPVAVLKSSNIYNIHTDHLGSPRKISNQTADVIWQWQDKPFGDSAVNQDPDGDGVAFEYNLRFAGQYFDQETGLHYNYFRYYDHEIGRYITSDPIGLEGGLNTFGYVGNNPINSTDPDGLSPLEGPGTTSTGRTGSPIDGSRVPRSTGEQITNRIISKIIEKATGKIVKVDPKTALLTPNPIGWGIGAMLYWNGISQCQTLTCDLDEDGFSDKEFSEGLCKQGFN